MKNSDKLVPELRFEGFQTDWTFEKLENLLDYTQPTKYLVKSTKYSNDFKTPVLTAGKSFILGYTNEDFGIWEGSKKPVIIFDDFTTSNHYVDFDFKVKSSAMKILTVKEGKNLRFIYSSIQTCNYKIEAHKRHWISEYSQIEMKIPSIEEQNRISSFLSNVDKKIKLMEEIQQLNLKYKKGLLQQMFVSNSVGGGL